MTIFMLAAALAATGLAAPKTGAAKAAEETKPQKMLLIPPPQETAGSQDPLEAEHGLVSNEALVALTVNRAMKNSPELATPAALRSAAGYRSTAIRDADNSHIAGTGFVTQGWDSGADAQTQGATNMTAHYGVFGTSLTFKTGGD